jgi:hypothetical protein
MLENCLHRIRVKARAIHWRQIRGKADQTPIDGKRFTIKSVAHNAVEGVLNVESGMLRTLIELFWRPGYMIRDYINGKRKCYMRPFHLLFVMAAIYIIAARIIFPENYVQPSVVNYATISRDITSLKDLARTDSARYFLDQMQQYADRTLRVEIADMTDSIGAENMEAMNRYWEAMTNIRENYLSESSTTGQVISLVSGWFSDNIAMSFLWMLPVFLICSRFVYRGTPIGKDMNIAEYIVAFVYVSSQIITFSLIMLPIAKLLGMNSQTIMWAMPLLLVWDYKQLFGISWWGSLWRIILLMVVSMIVMATASWIGNNIGNLLFMAVS